MNKYKVNRFEFELPDPDEDAGKKQFASAPAAGANTQIHAARDPPASAKTVDPFATTPMGQVEHNRACTWNL